MIKKEPRPGLSDVLSSVEAEFDAAYSDIGDMIEERLSEAYDAVQAILEEAWRGGGK